MGRGDIHVVIEIVQLSPETEASRSPIRGFLEHPPKSDGEGHAFLELLSSHSSHFRCRHSAYPKLALA